MKVLVLESEQGAAGEAVHDLQVSGHEVFRCHEPGEHPFPCNALVPGGMCPLVEERIDVALTVRSEPDERVLPLEDGVACALRCRVPLVVAGAPAENPYEGWRPAMVQGSDVAVKCEQAARSVNSEISDIEASPVLAVA